MITVSNNYDVSHGLDNLRILSLDGGGIKGQFALRILSCYKKMKASVKLSTVFDLVVGCSVGSFIGALVVYGFLDSDTDIETIVQKRFREFFDNENSSGPFLDTLYDGTGKTKMLRDIFADLKFGDAKVPFVVSTVSLLGGKPITFRSWEQSTSRIRLVDILDASSAAPMYYPPVRIGTDLLMDGGVLFNNPIELAILTALQLFHGAMSRQNCRILSLGVQTYQYSNTFPARNYGILSLLSKNFIDILLGSNNDIPVLIAKAVFGSSNVLRISTVIDVKMDSTRQKDIDNIVRTANEVWERNSKQIELFLS